MNGLHGPGVQLGLGPGLGRGLGRGLGFRRRLGRRQRNASPRQLRPDQSAVPAGRPT